MVGSAVFGLFAVYLVGWIYAIWRAPPGPRAFIIIETVMWPWLVGGWILERRLPGLLARARQPDLRLGLLDRRIVRAWMKRPIAATTMKEWPKDARMAFARVAVAAGAAQGEPPSVIERCWACRGTGKQPRNPRGTEPCPFCRRSRRSSAA
jgi:hypothetical protein